MQRHGNFIDGNWVADESEIENRNPSDIVDVIGLYAQAGRDQLERALDAAILAQEGWARTGIERRQHVLMRIGETLMARSAELGALLSREEGKPLAEGVGEVYRSGQFFSYFAA
ncbi:MAG: aldehyde dehydrogenase family protein, partial [Pseudomonadota bacterium]